MAKKIKKETYEVFQQVRVDDLLIGDVIYISNDEDAVEYTVLDLGNPFILIENNETHFAHLYHFDKLYKKIIKLKN